jgi:hypothetical protein
MGKHLNKIHAMSGSGPGIILKTRTILWPLCLILLRLYLSQMWLTSMSSKDNNDITSIFKFCIILMFPKMPSSQYLIDEYLTRSTRPHKTSTLICRRAMTPMKTAMHAGVDGANANQHRYVTLTTPMWYEPRAPPPLSISAVRPKASRTSRKNSVRRRTRYV